MGNVAATFFILRASQLLTPARGSDAAIQLALALYVVYNATATVVSIPAGRVGDRRGHLVVLIGGVVCFLVAFLGFSAAGATGPVLLLAFVTAGAGIGLVETAEHASVALLAPSEVRGSAFGLLAAIQCIGNLAASAIVGILWTIYSPTAAFVYLAVWMVVALAALVTLARRRFLHRRIDGARPDPE